MSMVEIFCKGTRKLPAELKWSKRCLVWHHLKLTFRAPAPSSRSQGEAVLAQYFSSIEKEKYNGLVIYKAEVSRVFGDRTRQMQMHM
jgi:hypothetical protein